MQSGKGEPAISSSMLGLYPVLLAEIGTWFWSALISFWNGASHIRVERVIKKHRICVCFLCKTTRSNNLCFESSSSMCYVHTERPAVSDSLLEGIFFHSGVLYLVSTLNNICLDSITLLKPEENPIKIPRVYLYSKRGVLQRRKPQEEWNYFKMNLPPSPDAQLFFQFSKKPLLGCC